MKFCFIILHYGALDETLKCVESIKSISLSTFYKIIIIDNASPDGSGVKLQNMFANSKYIDIVLNKFNLGFAKGNNVGFEIAKRKYGSHFIVLLNNDTQILQKDFCARVSKEYDYSNFAIMGPKIVLPDGRSSNYGSVMPTKWQSKLWLVKCYVYLVVAFIGLGAVIHNIKTRFKLDSGGDNNEIIRQRKEMCVINGSCLIFSPLYISRFDGLNPETFMYGEEQILFLRAKRNNLLTVYNPEIEISHEQEASTKQSMTSLRQRNVFYFSNQIKSTRVLLGGYSDNSEI